MRKRLELIYLDNFDLNIDDNINEYNVNLKIKLQDIENKVHNSR